MFTHENVLARVEQRQQLGDALQKFLPVLRLHGVTDLGVVIEDGRDDGKLHFDGDTNAEIVSFSNGEKFMQHLNLLTTIGT